MKLIRAIIRNESTWLKHWKKNCIYAMTRIEFYRSGQGDGNYPRIRYTEMPKEMLMIVLPDDAVTTAVSVIESRQKESSCRWKSRRR